VWTVDICDEAGKIAATGRVRMLVLPSGASAGGERIELK
jgi:hypothetical protein